MNSPFLPETSLSSWQFSPIEKHRPDAPPELMAIVGRMLARDPKRRPKSAKQTGEQLASLLEAAPSKKRGRAVHWSIPTTLAIVLIGITAWSFWPKSDQSRSSASDAPKPIPSVVDFPTVVISTEAPSWVKDRRIIRVAADGSSDFTTIQSALDKIESGEAIEIVGGTPYREWLSNKREIDDIGLFSRTGAVVETPRWEKNEGDKNAVDGPFLGAKNGFRLSGIEFRLPETPAGPWETLHGLNLFATGECIVENCVFWQPSQKTETTKASPFVMGITFHFLRETPIDLQLRGNLFRCGVAVMDWQHERRPVSAKVTLERNVIVSAKDAVWISFTHGEYVVKENLMWAVENGVGLVDRDESSSGFQLTMQNNTLAVAHFLYAGDVSSETVGKAEFVANVVANRKELGISSNEKDGPSLEKSWKRSKNWYSLEPAPHDSLLLADDEQIAPNMLDSEDWTNPTFGRLRSDSSAAAGGAGGKLPTYAGALAPDSDRSNDWAGRWRKHPAMRGW